MNQDSDNRKADFSCDSEARGHNVAPERAFVWHAVSELFLDRSWSDEELSWIAEDLANTRFSIQELSYIVSEEVAPVCFSNLLIPFGNESMGFNVNWLIEKCNARHAKMKYSPSGNANQIPLIVHIKSPMFFEAYLMLYRIKRLRVRDSKD